MVAWPLLALAFGPWGAVVVAAVLYGLWEIGQWHPGLTADCLLDWSVSMLGCVALAFVATGALLLAASAGAALLIVVAAGISARL